MKATASLKLSMERPPKPVVEGLRGLATTALADFLKLESVMRYAIRPLWSPMPRVAGPAFTVRTVPQFFQAGQSSTSGVPPARTFIATAPPRDDPTMTCGRPWSYSDCAIRTASAKSSSGSAGLNTSCP